MSFIIVAPALTAASITVPPCGCQMEIAVPDAASRPIIGSTRAISSPSQTKRRAGAGRLAANIDDRCTQRWSWQKLLRSGNFDIGILATIGEAVGCHVDDAHDLRLVEADGPLIQL